MRRFLLAPLLLVLGVPAAAQPVSPYVAFGGTYDPQNPFARILRGELPVSKVYEDRDVLVFMDAHPRAPGHVLVIARRSQARNVLEMKPALFARMMRIARRMVQAQRDALGVDGVVIQQNNGVAQSVPHLHIHVIPVTAGVPLAAAETTQPSAAELEAVAVRLRPAVRRAR